MASNSDIQRKVSWASHWAGNRMRDEIAITENYQNDPERVVRLSYRRCRVCHYGGPRIAGQSFTGWACQSCGHKDTFASTDTPKLCAACSDKLEACVDCMAALDTVPASRPTTKRRRNLP